MCVCLGAGCKPIERSQISCKVSAPIPELIPGSPQAGTECQRSSLRSDVRRGLKRPIFPSNLRLQCPGQAPVQNTMTNTSHGAAEQKEVMGHPGAALTLSIQTALHGQSFIETIVG